MADIVQRVAMKAVIVRDGKVLILREAKTYEEGTNIGRYHMPGGRLDPGENFEEGLKREVMEETGLEVELDFPVYVGEWRPVIKGVQNQIVATFIACKPTTDKEVVLSSEHDDFQWIDPAKWSDYDVMGPEGNVIDAYLKRVK